MRGQGCSVLAFRIDGLCFHRFLLLVPFGPEGNVRRNNSESVMPRYEKDPIVLP
jgi:hypothetical protein